MAEIANPKLELAERIFKTLVWDNAVEAAITALLAYCTWMAVPPLKQIVSGLIRLAANAFFSFVKLNLDVTAIRLSNAVAQSEYENASVRLMILAIENGPESEEFKRANEEDKKAFAKFVRFGATK